MALEIDWLSRAMMVVVLASAAYGQSYTISTAVGAGVPSNVQGKSTSLGVGVPAFLVADPAGDVFFVDQNSVVEMSASTGLLTMVAGNGTTGYSGDGGPATSAQLNGPEGLALDPNGNLYIADTGNNVIREVSGGTISTIAGNGAIGSGCANGSALSAPLNSPGGMAVDSHGNVYIADTGDYCIRRVSSGTITRVAGTGAASYSGDTGQAVNAAIGFTMSIAVDAIGNVYIADAGNERIREITVASGVIDTVAGNGTAGFGGDGGPATSAQLKSPLGVAVDSLGDIFIADADNNVIREVSGANIHTVAGDYALGAGFSGDTGGATQAQLSSPQTVALDGNSNLYIADQGNNRIREVSQGNINTIVGNGLIGDNGPASGAQLGSPYGIGLDPAGNLYIADTTLIRVRRVDAATGTITTLAGNGTNSASIPNGSSATSVGLDLPNGVAADRNGNVYISDAFSYAILKVNSGLIVPFAGNGTANYGGDGGPATQAEIGNPYGIATDSQGNVYLSDDLETDTTTANRVREVSNGAINTVAGNGQIGPLGDGGPATSAQLNFPAGLAVDSQGNLYIADLYNNEIRKVSHGTITTVAGNSQLTAPFSGDGGPATSAALNNPSGVAVDSQGNLYIADTGNNRIRMVSASNGFITTIAGNGTLGYTGDYGPATSAELNSPTDVAVNSAGSVLVADSSGRIRVLTPTGSTSCSYTGIPSTLPVTAAGGSQNIAVGTTAFCPWAISGLPNWIAFTGPAGNTGPGTAGFSVAANSGASRFAVITIAGVSVGVTQAGTQGSNNPCDINKDGMVNVADVQLMVNQSLGGLAGANDLNGDGVVNAVDVQVDTNAALNLGCSGNAAPRHVAMVLVIDRSGSMGAELPALQAGATDFVNQFTAGRDKLGLVLISGSAFVAYPPGDWGANPPAGATGPDTAFKGTTETPNMLTTISNIKSGSNTGTAEGLMLAWKELQAANDPGALNIIVLWTDGAPNGITADFNNSSTPSLKSGGGCTNTNDGTNGRYPNVAANSVLGWFGEWGGYAYNSSATNGIRERIQTSTSGTSVTSWAQLATPGTDGSGNEILLRTSPGAAAAGCNFGNGSSVASTINIPSVDYYGNSTQGSNVAPYTQSDYKQSIIWNATSANCQSGAGGTGGVPLTLSGTLSGGLPPSGNACQVGLASWNAADMAARQIHADTTLTPIIYTMGYAGSVSGSGGVDTALLMRMANCQPGVPCGPGGANATNTVYNSTIPSGMYFQVQTVNDVTAAFQALLAEILRLSM